MAIAADLVIAVVAILHVGFLVLEMLLWNHPVGRRTFGMTAESAKAYAALAANPGLYNGFLAAGLIWGLVFGSTPLKMFFLAFVVIAGVFGGSTASHSIFFVHALPGMAGPLLLYLSAG